MTYYLPGSKTNTVVLGTFASTYGYTSANAYSYGIQLTVGAGLSITGSTVYGQDGVYSYTTGVSLTNHGTITGGSSTVSAGKGGAGPGGIGVDLRNTGGTLNNDGKITGGGGIYGNPGGRGVYINHGTLNNYTSANGAGRIIGGYVSNGAQPGGVGAQLVGGTGTNGQSAAIVGGSSVKNGASGNGGVGLVLSSSATLKNNGQLSGGSGNATGGAAVQLSTGATLNNNNLVTGGTGHFLGGAGVIDSGSILNNNSGGRIIGGGGLPIAGSTSAINGGTGVQLNSGSTLNNKNGATITGGTGLYGGNTGIGVKMSTGSVLTNQGKIYDGVTVSSGATATNYGGLYATANRSGLYVNGGKAYQDSGRIVGGNTLVGGSYGAGVTLNSGTFKTTSFVYGGGNNGTGASVQFGSSLGATLVVGYGARFFGAIAGFNSKDTVDISNINPTTLGGDYTPGSHVLATGIDGTLTFTGNFTGLGFKFTSDGNGGTNVTLAACYLKGTRVRTPSGDVAIEKLSIGDEVSTLSGTARAIRWIGRRQYSRQSAAGNRGLLPIRFDAGSLGDNLPVRDLWVSPEHAMWLDGALYPAHALVNGHSIVQEMSFGDIDYVHVELDTHDVIFAEGAHSESFVDADNREHFDNAADYAVRYPDAKRESARFCAPRIEDGVELEAIRQRLNRPVITRAA